MKIAFIGGTRFIGHAAAAAALARGHDVAVLHRGCHPCELAGARAVLVDRADPSALCETLARLAPDVVVDTRAMTRPDAEATALALKIIDKPAVVLSSVDVYAQFGRLNGLPCASPPEAVVTESSPLTIPYPYRGLIDHECGPDYDKKDVEAVFASARDSTILRLPAVYGARDFGRRFGTVVDALDAGSKELPHIDNAPWRQTHAHVRDVAHAVVLAAEQSSRASGVFNVGEAATPTMRERVEAIARAMRVTFRWVAVETLPDEFHWLGPMPNDLVIDSAKLRRSLGFAEVTSADERLEDLISWLRSSREEK